MCKHSETTNGKTGLWQSPPSSPSTFSYCTRMQNNTNGTPQPNQQSVQQSAVPPASQVAASQHLVTALANIFKNTTGENQDRIANVLLQNMTQITELAKQGKLNQAQISQVCATFVSRSTVNDASCGLIVERVCGQ